jgi:hypothetical protein
VFDSTSNFQATTYYLRPQVVHLVPPGETDPIGVTVDAAILSAITTNMNARGYTSSTDSTTADIKVMAAATTTEYQGYYWDYWCYTWYYYCPPYWGTYEFTLGTLIITMKDRRVAGTGAEAMWLGIGNGMLSGVPNPANVTSAVNQMYAQSPYISAN